MGLADCQVCRRTIDGDEAAVGTPASGNGGPRYVPFVEDLRTSGLLLTHTSCFVDQHGLEALIALVHDHDRQVREQISDLVRTVAQASEDASES